MVRTRIAPSPTGYPHIGTIYQALFNYAYAKKHDGRFIVRIEDTDRTRFVEGSEDVIFTSLDWAGLTEDESPRKGGDFGPYRQSERLSLYHEYAQILVDKGHAYFSYYKKEDAGVKKDYSKKDTPEASAHVVDEAAPKTISEMISRTDWILRMKVPKGEKIIFHDEIRGDIEFDTNQVTDQVLIKSDGFPTYHFAVVVDDHLMKISQILRAEEWISSTPKHILLYKYFDWDMPPVYHTATLRNPDKSKLSKRHGHTNVVWFQQEGYVPEAVLNFLALLGWTHPAEKEIFSLREFISLFDFKDIRPVAPIFDLQKLDWMNGIYIREVLSSEELIQRLYAFDNSLQNIDKKMFEGFVEVAKTRIKTLKEFKEMVMPFIHPVHSAGTIQNEVLVHMKNDLKKLEIWDQKNLEGVILDGYIRTKRMSFKDVYMALIGTDKGLPLIDTFLILGKEKTLALFHE